MIEAEQRVAVFDLHFVEQLSRRLVFDDEADVAHVTRESLGNGIDRFFDELAKMLLRHGRLAFLAPALSEEASFLEGGLARSTALRLTGFVTTPVR